MYYDEFFMTPLTHRDTCFVSVIGRDSRPASTQAPLKRRDCAVIHYVLEGEGWFDGHKIRAGQGFYFPADELHTYQADSNHPWYYIFLDVSQTFADWFVVPALNADERGIFSFSFREQLQRWADRTFKDSRVMISQIEAIYHASSILRRHTPPEDEGSVKQEFYVQKAKLFIESNLNRRMTVVEVANAVNLNERYLCSLFVQYERVTTKDYITARKLQIACDLLTSTALSIKEIALSIGFADANCFSKIFRQKFGMAPSQYREQA